MTLGNAASAKDEFDELLDFSFSWGNGENEEDEETDKEPEEEKGCQVLIDYEMTLESPSQITGGFGLYYFEDAADRG